MINTEFKEFGSTSNCPYIKVYCSSFKAVSYQYSEATSANCMIRTKAGQLLCILKFQILKM